MATCTALLSVWGKQLLIQCSWVPATVNHDYQLDLESPRKTGLWACLWRNYLNCINWSGKTCPLQMAAVHDWDLRLREWKKSLSIACVHLLSDSTVDSVPCHFDFPPMLAWDCVPAYTLVTCSCQTILSQHREKKLSRQYPSQELNKLSSGTPQSLRLYLHCSELTRNKATHGVSFNTAGSQKVH